MWVINSYTVLRHRYRQLNEVQLRNSWLKLGGTAKPCRPIRPNLRDELAFFVEVNYVRY